VTKKRSLCWETLVPFFLLFTRSLFLLFFFILHVFFFSTPGLSTELGTFCFAISFWGRTTLEGLSVPMRIFQSRAREGYPMWVSAPLMEQKKRKKKKKNKIKIKKNKKGKKKRKKERENSSGSHWKPCGWSLLSLLPFVICYASDLHAVYYCTRARKRNIPDIFPFSSASVPSQ